MDHSGSGNSGRQGHVNRPSGDAHQQQQQQQQRHWGKRLREDGDQVRFSDLTPEQKMLRRKQERHEKKERERTLSYFKSVQRTLDEHARGGDPTVLANIVDGFFGELLKLLKADPSFHLLRNGVVCRAIEAALGSAMLLQSKTLLYVFLGRIAELVTSPVASYTFETLVVSLSLGLSALSQSNPEGFEAEVIEGGPGMHTGSGVPSTATLLRSMVEELTERAEDLLVHEVGSRALRSIILVLGGHAIRNAPPPQCPVKHPALLGTLAEATIGALEEGYGREYQTATAAEAWLAAAQAPTTSFIVQSLLRVSEEGTPCYAAVVGRLEGLQYKNKPLLWHLMVDHNLGSHLFQAYTRVPTPAAVVDMGDAEAIQLERRLRHKASQQGSQDGGPAAHKGKRAATDKLRALAAEKSSPATTSTAEPGVDGTAAGTEEALLACCWGKGLRMVQTAFSVLISGQQMPFILQDLALAAPTAAHLYLLWEQLLARHLSALTGRQGGAAPGAAALAVLARKCAFAAAEREDGTGAAAEAGGVSSGGSSSGNSSIPADLNNQLRADEGQGVRYFPVSAALQRTVCEQLCEALGDGDNDAGAARCLLTDGDLGDKGLDLARCLLHFHPTASRRLQRGIDALPSSALLSVAEHHKGSLVLQQYLTSTSYWAATGKDGGAAHKTATEGGEEGEHREAALRFLRKVEGHMHELVFGKYGPFVVETLYEVGSVAAKEATVEALMPLFTSLRDEPEPADKAESLRRHVARKVMTRCCVEQYTHRREDWLKLAQRQVQVQRLMWRMMLEG